MRNLSGTGVACANIAFIKYWGDRDAALHIPSNGSLSMNLDGLITRTRVAFDTRLAEDQLVLNGQSTSGQILLRVSTMLDKIRQAAGLQHFAEVTSENNFPMGAGIASSASAFAALALAGSAAAGLELTESGLSSLARTGSGSACRSVPGGFVEWQAGSGDEDSYAVSIAPPDHWDLVDLVAVVSRDHKAVGSTGGHQLAGTSPLQVSRVQDAPRRLDLCRQAILTRDFDAFAEIVELDSSMMHAVMITSKPPLLYWLPGTIAVMQAVHDWRRMGLPVCFTIDAGSNVHVICERPASEYLKVELEQVPGVQSVLVSSPGGPARLVNQAER